MNYKSMKSFNKFSLILSYKKILMKYSSNFLKFKIKKKISCKNSYNNKRQKDVYQLLKKNSNNYFKLNKKN